MRCVPRGTVHLAARPPTSPGDRQRGLSQYAFDLAAVPVRRAPQVMLCAGPGQCIPPDPLLKVQLAAAGFQLCEHDAVTYQREIRPVGPVGRHRGPPAVYCPRWAEGRPPPADQVSEFDDEVLQLHLSHLLYAGTHGGPGSSSAAGQPGSCSTATTRTEPGTGRGSSSVAPHGQRPVVASTRRRASRSFSPSLRLSAISSLTTRTRNFRAVLPIRIRPAGSTA